MTLVRRVNRPIGDGGPVDWLSSPGARALVAAALVMSLVFGGLFVSIDRLHSSPSNSLNHPAHPASDSQSKTEVVEPAKQIVGLARLPRPVAGYILMSCKNHDDPPYQGAIYMTFAVPAGVRADTYFRSVAATLAAHGWHEGLEPTARVYGKTLYKDGVTAIIYRDSDYPNLGIARLYGQCRNMSNHRNDMTAWTDISDQFGQVR